MKKVTIEITPNGWETTVVLEHINSKEVWTRTIDGAICTTVTFEEQEEFDDSLIDSLERGDPHDIMDALKDHSPVFVSSSNEEQIKEALWKEHKANYTIKELQEMFIKMSNLSIDFNTTQS